MNPPARGHDVRWTGRALVALVKRFQSCANSALIQPHSAVVEPGQAVAAGTRLGRSGNIGFSSGPRTTSGVVRDLQAGQEYTRP